MYILIVHIFSVGVQPSSIMESTTGTSSQRNTGRYQLDKLQLQIFNKFVLFVN